MAQDRPEASAPNGTDAADLAKAFQELARGEQTAAALETQLNAIEAKIELMLAQAEQNRDALTEDSATATTNGDADGAANGRGADVR